MYSNRDTTGHLNGSADNGNNNNNNNNNNTHGENSAGDWTGQFRAKGGLEHLVSILLNHKQNLSGGKEPAY